MESTAATAKFAFGSLRHSDQGRIELRESKSVSLADSDGFGWAMKIVPPKSAIVCKEVLYMPAAATNAQEDVGGIRFLDGGRTAVRETPVAAGSSTLSQLWSVTSQDSKGHYRLVIFLDGRPVEDVRFDLLP